VSVIRPGKKAQTTYVVTVKNGEPSFWTSAKTDHRREYDAGKELTPGRI
jgi:hypothetical protein